MMKTLLLFKKTMANTIYAFLLILFFILGINFVLKSGFATYQLSYFGYPLELTTYFGIFLIISTIFFSLKQTYLFGALLLTAWLSGATASHIVHRDQLYFTLLPILFGIMLWFSTIIRSKKLRKIKLF